MLLPVKAIIKKEPRKDGKHVIYFQYCYSSTNRVLLNTEIAIPHTYWNTKRQFITKSLPAEIGDAEQLNKELSRIQKIVETLIEKGLAEKASHIGEYVKSHFCVTGDVVNTKGQSFTLPTKKKEPELFAEIDSYIKSKERKICEKGLSNLKSLKAHLVAFQTFCKKPITFSSFDYNFYCDFVEFLTYDYEVPRKKIPVYGLKVNTVGKTIKQLRVFINDRVRQDHPGYRPGRL